MSLATFTVPVPKNEPVLSYLPGSSERKALRSQINEMKSSVLEIPLVIGGMKVKTGDLGQCTCPHNHQHVLANYHRASEKEVQAAVEAALAARKKWQEMPWEARASIFQRAAELLAVPWRHKLNAATMLSQSKNVMQAEIDAACELIDFFRFNVFYAQQISKEQPSSSSGVWNRLEQRALEGFVFAVTPFNFTSIAANLPAAPALMGNVVLWKPASSSVYSGWWLMELFKEAGLPPGIINFLPGKGAVISDVLLTHRDLAGVHFTGSTRVFQNMWKKIGENIGNYRSYPRIVGETGGKDFVFVHKSANVEEVVTALVRGAFEYQGQKCSAASRCYVPDNLWPTIKKRLIEEVGKIKMGDVEDFTCLVNAVIDEAAFQRIAKYIDYAKSAPDAEILVGGGYDDSKGWFIEPTIVETTSPLFKTMEEEVFGPLLTVYVYEANAYDKTLRLCDETSPYALTGAIFARDREAIVEATNILKYAAGNFYINDKPTGAVVGQQPFGGGRASGTNDKAGSMLNLLRWVSPRTIKENFSPPTSVPYGYMVDDE